VNKTSENYLKMKLEKVDKLKENSSIKQKNLLKMKEIEEKHFENNLSKVVSNMIKKDEIIKSILTILP